MAVWKHQRLRRLRQELPAHDPPSTHSSRIIKPIFVGGSLETRVHFVSFGAVSHRVLPRWVRKMGAPTWMSGAALFPTLANAMCVAFLIPLGLVFPLLTIERLYEDGSATKSDLPNQLISYIIIASALVVSTAAVLVNARMNQMDMELRKEAGIKKIMIAARTISVVLPKPIAIIIFDEIMIAGKEQAFRVMLAGELLTWIQLGGDAMRVVTAVSLKTQEMLHDLTHKKTLPTFNSFGRNVSSRRRNSGKKSDAHAAGGAWGSGEGRQDELLKGVVGPTSMCAFFPWNSLRGSDVSSRNAASETEPADEMVFGDDELLSTLLGCGCFFPTWTSRVAADAEGEGRGGARLGRAGSRRWSRSTSLMRAKGLMRPTWLAARNPYMASGSLHLVRISINEQCRRDHGDSLASTVYPGANGQRRTGGDFVRSAGAKRGCVPGWN
jgi:hypothetical protein